jgi:hypothetical protein
MKYAITDNKKIVSCFNIKDINNIDDGDYNYIMMLRYLFLTKLNLGFDEAIIFSDCKAGDFIKITGNHSTEIGNIKEAVVHKSFLGNLDFTFWFPIILSILIGIFSFIMFFGSIIR